MPPWRSAASVLEKETRPLGSLPMEWILARSPAPVLRVDWWGGRRATSGQRVRGMVMRAIGAAILVLAAAVFFGTTAIGIAILIGAGKEAGFLIWGYLPGLVL